MLHLTARHPTAHLDNTHMQQNSDNSTEDFPILDKRTKLKKKTSNAFPPVTNDAFTNERQTLPNPISTNRFDPHPVSTDVEDNITENQPNNTVLTPNTDEELNDQNMEDATEVETNNATKIQTPNAENLTQN